VKAVRLQDLHNMYEYLLVYGRISNLEAAEDLEGSHADKLLVREGLSRQLLRRYRGSLGMIVGLERNQS
jgi:hypothetical protein